MHTLEERYFSRIYRKTVNKAFNCETSKQPMQIDIAPRFLLLVRKLFQFVITRRVSTYASVQCVFTFS